VVLLAFVIARLVQQADQIPSIRWSVAGVIGLGGAILLSAVPNVVAALGMPILLRAEGVSVTLGESFAIVGRSQLGKYLPGNVFHYLGRVALGVRRGIPAPRLSLAVGAETALTGVVAIAIGVAGWSIDGSPAPRAQMPLDTAFLSFALGILVAAAVGGVLLRSRLTAWLNARRIHAALRTALAAAGLYVLAFAALGAAIALLVRGVFGIDAPWGWLQFTWRFALIWVLGMLTIGAPAGLGVREALMVVWFSPVIGESPALGLAGLLRVVTTAADVLVFFASYVAAKE
jgi:hypothetical protein